VSSVKPLKLRTSFMDSPNRFYLDLWGRIRRYGR